MTKFMLCPIESFMMLWFVDLVMQECNRYFSRLRRREQTHIRFVMRSILRQRTYWKVKSLTLLSIQLFMEQMQMTIGQIQKYGKKQIHP